MPYRTERDRVSWRRRKRRLWRGVRRNAGVLALGAVVAGVVVSLIVAAGQDDDLDLSNVPPLPTQSEPEERAVLVVGDSWTTGGSMNKGPTWPFLLDLPPNWTLLTDTGGGTGYVGAGTVPHPGILSGRLEMLVDDYHPDVALIELGRNDVEQPTSKVVKVAREALTALKEGWPRCRIVVFSPFSPGDPDPGTVALTDGLRQVAASLDLGFVDVSGLIGTPPGRLIENYHPTDPGHRLIARAVGARLDQLGVFEGWD